MPEPDTPWWKGERGEYYVIAQLVLFAVVVFAPSEVPGVPSWTPPFTWLGTAVGALSMVSGATLAASGLLRLGDSLTPLPYPKDCATLVQSGPYRIVRHPIYSGLIIAAFGWGAWLNSWLTLGYAAALLVFFDIKSRREERWLVERYDGYLDYRSRVKKLIPWIY